MTSLDGRYILYDRSDKVPHEVWSFDTETNANTKVVDTPRNSLALSLTNDGHLVYGAYTPESESEPFPATNQEHIGIHSIDLSTGAETLVVPDQSIGSVDSVQTGPAGPTPLLVLPNYEFVALGDSYSSGEGAPVKSADGKVRYIVGTDTDTDKCHRSMGAYPVLTHEAVGKGSGFIFKACSGTLIEDFWSTYYENHRTNPEEGPQLDWLNARTKVITLTVGGNNAHFGEVMEYCATRAIFEASCEATWKGAIESAISNMTTRGNHHDDLASLYDEIKHRAPNAKIYVISYPRFFPQALPLYCQTGVVAPTAPQPSFIVPDMEWVNHEIAILNSAIKKSAESAGAHYVDIYNSLQGHELCSPSPWLNAAKGEVSNKRRIESYHPSKEGQTAIAKLVESAIS